MRLTVEQLAELVGGASAGDAQFNIDAVGPLESCPHTGVCYLADPRKTALLENCTAGCVIVPSELKGRELPYKGPLIYSDKPQWAFTLILRQLALEKKPKIGWGIHPSAVVDTTARIGKYVNVGANAVVEAGAVIGDFSVIYPQCYIGRGVKVGKNCLFYPQVIVREECEIGDRVILHAGVVIGSDGFGYLQMDGRHEKIPQLGKVVIEDDVELGSLTAVDRAMLEETRIGAGTKVDNLVQIAHNVKVGRACIIVSQAGIAGSSSLGDGVVIAGQAGVNDHIKIGSRSIVTAQSGVLSDLPDGSVVFGSPARPHHDAMKIQAALGKLPELIKFARAVRKKLGLDNGDASDGTKKNN